MYHNCADCSVYCKCNKYKGEYGFTVWLCILCANKYYWVIG